MKIKTNVIEINRVLDREWNKESRLSWACGRIAWLARYHKVPKELTDALVIKATAIIGGEWFGDEAEEEVITAYIREMR